MLVLLCGCCCSGGAAAHKRRSCYCWSVLVRGGCLKSILDVQHSAVGLDYVYNGHRVLFVAITAIP